ncbi:MAG: carbon-nitrogen hydrolase family protein, partial [Cyclobacteriaceae bacterium]|nr:carbon-nitrogen hydrolase family protein [Cyclobacteriaceae bacterium]
TRQVYSKQLLHEDELPYFVAGNEQILISIADTKIAPAISYESLQSSHVDNFSKLGAHIYLASVAKSELGITTAMDYYSEISIKYNMPVLVSNSIGPCDNFISAGKSSVWNDKGILLAQLDSCMERVLIFNTETNLVKQVFL